MQNDKNFVPNNGVTNFIKHMFHSAKLLLNKIIENRIKTEKPKKCNIQVISKFQSNFNNVRNALNKFHYVDESGITFGNGRPTTKSIEDFHSQ